MYLVPFWGPKELRQNPHFPQPETRPVAENRISPEGCNFPVGKIPGK